MTEQVPPIRVLEFIGVRDVGFLHVRHSDAGQHSEMVRPMSERVFERANQGHGVFFVAGFAATAHWCPVEITTVDRLHGSMVRQ